MHEDTQTLEAIALLEGLAIPYEFTLSRYPVNKLWYCKIFHGFKAQDEQSESYIGRGETLALAVNTAYALFQAKTPYEQDYKHNESVP